ncbi:MAG TPA: hypothetical protein VFR86_07975, partial [Burkholderiaceae bacterium]|nr:hypothetical protein [Burkholderiaceae bacterium]
MRELHASTPALQEQAAEHTPEVRVRAATPPPGPQRRLVGARLRHYWSRLKGAQRPDLLAARLLGRWLPDRLYMQLGHALYFRRWPDF